MKMRLLALLCLNIFPFSLIHAGEGVDYAKEALSRFSAASNTRPDWSALKSEVRSKIQEMPGEERLEFLRELVLQATADSPEKSDPRLGELALGLMGAADLSRSERVQAFAPLLSDSNPEIAKAAARLIAGAEVTTDPSGARIVDFSVFAAALVDETSSGNGRLIELMFKQSPNDAGNWFSDSVQLTDEERRVVKNELALGKVIRTRDEPWELEKLPGDQTNLSPEGKLREWAASESWILRLYAKSFFAAHFPGPPQDLKEIMAAIRAPERVDFVPNISEEKKEVKREIPRTEHANSGSEDRQSPPSELILGRWLPWLAAIIIAIGSLWWFLGKSAKR